MKRQAQNLRFQPQEACYCYECMEFMFNVPRGGSKGRKYTCADCSDTGVQKIEFLF